MKKLFTLTFVLLLSVGLMAQNPGDAWFFAGSEPVPTGPDPFTDWAMADMSVAPNGWYNVPVYMMVSDGAEAAGIVYPLGIKYDLIDSFYTADAWPEYPIDPQYPIYPPFHDYYGPVTPVPWAAAAFQGPNDDTHPTQPCPPGYKSLTFFGAFNLSGNPPFAPFFTSTIPALAFTYYVHAKNDPGLIDPDPYCDAFAEGRDPIQGGGGVAKVFAEGGGEFYSFNLFYSCVLFSPNQAPVIEPFDLPYDCGYTDFEIPVDIYDIDGDAIVLESLTAGEFIPNGFTPDDEGDGITWHYIIDFDMEDFCGDCFSGDVILSINDGNEHPVSYNAGSIIIIGEIVASMTDLWIYPGMEDWMPIYLDDCGYCFCLGGFTFTVCFDPSILSVTEVLKGDALEFGEIWTVTWDIEGPGTIRLFFVNDMNNQEQVPLICDLDPEEPIAFLKFLLNPGYQYPTNFCTPICFCEEVYTDNAVSADDGYHVWIPEGCDDPPDSIEYGTMLLTLECGNIKIIDDCNIVYGDINLNGFPNEVGDVVLLANHLIDPIAYPFTLRQMFASDVNGDGYQATIADLIWMINYINGFGGGKVTPLDVAATVSMPTSTEGNVDVMISSETSVGGAMVSINHAGFEIGAPVAEGMDLVYNDNGEVMTVVVYNMEANSFAPGSNVLFTIPDVAGDLTFGDVSVSDNRGALLDARAELSIPLPTEFTVAQNYPNPFNAMTRINFTLPSDANVNINIYNVAGQMVESIDNGKMAAGYHSVAWDASDVASGIYFYKVVAGDHSKTMKMTLLK